MGVRLLDGGRARGGIFVHLGWEVDRRAWHDGRAWFSLVMYLTVVTHHFLIRGTCMYQFKMGD